MAKNFLFWGKGHYFFEDWSYIFPNIFFFILKYYNYSYYLCLMKKNSY